METLRFFPGFEPKMTIVLPKSMVFASVFGNL